jgi:hypothetical protein
MEKEFINYTEALALKELGFDEPCFGYYYTSDKKEVGLEMYIDVRNQDVYYVQAPLYQQAFRWFREKKIHSIVQEYAFKNYMFSIDDGINRDVEVIGYNTYEEAELECLKKLIEIVKNNEK